MKMTMILLVAAAGASEMLAMKPVVYRRPAEATEAVRVDGRLRAAEDVLVTLTVLAPEELGLTSRSQPCLFWYQSQGSHTRFELTIVRGADARPVYETQMVPNGTAGIRRFSLREHGVTLEPNVEYRWTVAIVTDPENRSKDVVASGVIKHVPPTEKLSARLAANPEDRAFVYADEGFWYDSLEELSTEIEQKPSERELRKVRGMLFLQAGLKEAADHDLQTAGKPAAPKQP
jgi:hypothetical protein